MSIVKELCLREEILYPMQMQRMETICGMIGLISDIAHSQATVYILAKQSQSMVIIAQANPNTTYIQQGANKRGNIVHATEEPLIWRTIEQAKPIAGKREWNLGMFSSMQTYPIWDNDAKVIGAISYESPAEDADGGQETFIHTANMFVEYALQLLSGKLYRRLSARDGLMIIDASGKIIGANVEASSIYNALGVGRIVGRRISDRQIDLRIAQKAAFKAHALESETELGSMIFLHRVIPIVNNGKAIRMVLVVTDITETKRREKELLIKSAVIQEIHHRVKNNLQTIASLLRLQARRTSSNEVKAALKESVNRILSISVVHEFLSQHDEEFIDVAEIGKNILDVIIQNMLEPNVVMDVQFKGSAMILPSEQATSIALVINELIQNSLEHGFIGRTSGIIGLRLTTEEKYYHVEIYDDGVGFSDENSLLKSKSLGLQIVRTLIETDLGGSFNLKSDNGVHANILIPRECEGGI